MVRIDGSPSIGAKPLVGAGHVRAGEWIETDAHSQALVQVGEIGSVQVAPNTRVRVVTAQQDEHRLALARGEIHASISAPPKLFFVDTASGTAVDLGCEYSLIAADDGSSLLRVIRGWVSFEWKEIDSLVPAGATCRTRPHLGPGIPYFDDASAKLKQAADAFGLEKSGDTTLNVILSASRVRDTLTLWHLLARVDPPDRNRVYDHLASVSPPPAGVTREMVLKLDAAALQRWRDDLAWKW
ncbi:MAG: FecR domain-containing protein [Acidobacteriia bacterium]|nr:FecR domain-containing protein [Terriglobia bacterium]MBV8903818.1 FecR domain-containing protein [Terriglobia bacterium]